MRFIYVVCGSERKKNKYFVDFTLIIKFFITNIVFCYYNIIIHLSWSNSYATYTTLEHAAFIKKYYQLYCSSESLDIQQFTYNNVTIFVYSNIIINLSKLSKFFHFY